MAATLKLYRGAESWHDRAPSTIRDLLGLRHNASNRMLTVASAKLEAVRLLQAAGWTQMRPAHLRVEDGHWNVAEVLKLAGLLDSPRVIAMGDHGSSQGVVTVDLNGPRLVGYLVSADGGRRFLPEGAVAGPLLPATDSLTDLTTLEAPTRKQVAAMAPLRAGTPREHAWALVRLAHLCDRHGISLASFSWTNYTAPDHSLSVHVDSVGGFADVKRLGELLGAPEPTRLGEPSDRTMVTIGTYGGIRVQVFGPDR